MKLQDFLTQADQAAAKKHTVSAPCLIAPQFNNQCGADPAIQPDLRLSYNPAHLQTIPGPGRLFKIGLIYVYHAAYFEGTRSIYDPGKQDLYVDVIVQADSKVPLAQVQPGSKPAHSVHVSWTNFLTMSGREISYTENVATNTLVEEQVQGNTVKLQAVGPQGTDFVITLGPLAII